MLVNPDNSAISKTKLISLRNLLDISSLTLNDFDFLFSSSESLHFSKTYAYCTLFLEPSTRTKLSFELAIKNLNFKHIDFSPEHSSLKKGESLIETLWTLKAMGVHGVIIRSKEDTILHDIFELQNQNLHSIPRLINAGTGTSHHPTQCLLDLLTMKETFASELSFREFLQHMKEKKILIAGDISHSRVASSWRELGQKFDLNIHFLDPAYNQNTTDWDDSFFQSDFIMMLRMQKERHHFQEKELEQFQNEISRDYLKRFGLNRNRLNHLKNSAYIMHPGPYNLGVEISEEVLKDSRWIYYQQIASGVQIRKKILLWLHQDEL